MAKKNSSGYTLGEEIFSSVTHGIGALLGIAALVLMIIFTTVGKGSALDIVGVCIYGATLILLYTISTLYHSLTNPTAKKVFKILDHCSIYLLIAGTFTPMCFTCLISTGYKMILLVTWIWVAAILGIVLYACFPNRFKILNVALYILMGWSIVFMMGDLIAILKAAGAMSTLYLLLAGGIAYTAGVIFYAFKKVPYFHSIFHLFVLGGSICHFFAVLLFII